jgi:mannose-1-phosphate guanylyltransferase
MNRRIIPLIMCGGAGTRLWPASREVHPKQFLPLFGARSTFQDTLLRVSDAALFERPVIITNNAYRFMVLEQLAEIGLEADVLLEPMRRDSGPAIAAGAAFAQARDKDAIVLALAADHVVSDTPAFLAACREGLAAAEAGHIVTFGVQPERAATEYGYINPGEVIAGKVRAVAKFVEKPDPATAADYVEAGYLWNSGNFMFRAAVLTDEYRKIDAESVQAVSDAVAKVGIDLGFVKLDEAAFGSEVDLDRLRRDGKDRARRGGAGCVRLVRCRLLACGVGIVREGRRRQRGAGYCGVRGFPQLQRIDRPRAGRARRRRRPRGGRDPGRRAGLQATGRQRAEAAGRQAEDGGAAGDRGSHQGAPAVGILPVGRQWRPSSGQAHHRQARRAALAAEAPPPGRALDRGVRNGAGHRQ